MSRSPPIRAANFLPLAVKFITALTGYRRTRPHTGLDPIKPLWYTSYRMESRRMPGYMGMQMWAERCLVFLWILFTGWEFLISYEWFLQMGIKVVKMLRKMLWKKHLKSDHWRGNWTSSPYSVMRNLGRLISSWSHFIFLSVSAANTHTLGFHSVCIHSSIFNQTLAILQI